MGLLERFFHKGSGTRPAITPLSESGMNARAGVATSRRKESLRDALALDVSLITPDMPYEEAQRRFDALSRFDAQMPPVKISK